MTVKRSDDLAKKTNNPSYNGWIVEDIGTTDIFDGEGYIKFTNGKKIEEGDKTGSDKEEIFRQQIRRTIQNHFRRKNQLVPMGIKPLALFFIDRVANYVEDDGLIRRLFVEEYTALYQKEHGKPPAEIEAVHGGYFAQTAKGTYVTDGRVADMAKNQAIYDRILKDKKQLLSFDDKLV